MVDKLREHHEEILWVGQPCTKVVRKLSATMDIPILGMYTGDAYVDVKFGWYPVQTRLIHVLSYAFTSLDVYPMV